MNIIFLGKQGVLNNFDYEKKARDMYHKNGRLKVNIDPKNIKVLKRMIELTKAKIVLTSEWNIDFDSKLKPSNQNAKKIKKVLEKEGLEVLDMIENDFSTTNDEIKNWLDKNENVEDFVILDDKSEVGKYKSKLIQTDYGDGGLKEGHISILKQKMKTEDSTLSKTKIEQALDQIKKKDFHSNKINPFTTENIDGYLKYFNLKAKSLLTVGSSSDQVLNAFYLGCRDITLLDTNPYIEEYFYLKKSAITTLDYKEFFKFLSFGRNIFLKSKTLNKKVFQEVINNIEKKDSKEFWDNLLEFSTPKKIKSKLFTSDNIKIPVLKKYNTYLKNEESYEFLRGKIKNLKPTFIQADIYAYSLERNYDNILLSNISSYYNPEDTEKLYNQLKEHLNENGQMLKNYFYSNESKIEEQKISENTELKTIDGIKTKDSILIYKKVK